MGLLRGDNKEAFLEEVAGCVSQSTTAAPTHKLSGKASLRCSARVYLSPPGVWADPKTAVAPGCWRWDSASPRPPLGSASSQRLLSTHSLQAPVLPHLTIFYKYYFFIFT